MLCLATFVEYHHSLLTHLYPLAHELPNINCAALFYPHHLKLALARKGVFVNLFKCIEKRDFFDSTVTKTIFSDVLYAVRNFKFFEILAIPKCPPFESFQCRREFDTFYRTPRKNSSLAVIPADNLFFTKFLQSLVQLHTPQLFAFAKRTWLDVLNARWEDDLFKTTKTETISPDSLKTVWEPDVLQVRATRECVITYLFQRASRLENHVSQTGTVSEGATLNFHNAFRNDYSFYSTFTETSFSNLPQYTSFCER